MAVLHTHHPIRVWGEAAGAALLLLAAGGGIGLLTGYAVLRLLGLLGAPVDTDLRPVLGDALPR
jgi:hypothetical protein